MLQLRLSFLFLKFVLIIWILEIVNNDFEIAFNDSFGLDEVTHLHEVHPHVLARLQELLLLLSKEFRCDPWLTPAIFHCRHTTQLLLNAHFLFFV